MATIAFELRIKSTVNNYYYTVAVISAIKDGRKAYFLTQYDREDKYHTVLTGSLYSFDAADASTDLDELCKLNGDRFWYDSVAEAKEDAQDFIDHLYNLRGKRNSYMCADGHC